MLIQMFCSGQQVGELPVADFKSACYYVLEQIVEHRVDQWDFNDMERESDVALCLKGYSIKDREKAEEIVQSGSSAVVFRDHDKVHIFSVKSPDSPEWKEIFNLFRKMYDNDTRSISVT